MPVRKDFKALGHEAVFILFLNRPSDLYCPKTVFDSLFGVKRPGFFRRRSFCCGERREGSFGSVGNFLV